jgi:hypothetical protein
MTIKSRMEKGGNRERLRRGYGSKQNLIKMGLT